MNNNYAWRLPSGSWWCDKKDKLWNTKISSTPYLNRAKLFPDRNSAMFCKPNVDFTLELHRIEVKTFLTDKYEPTKKDSCSECGKTK